MLYQQCRRLSMASERIRQPSELTTSSTPDLPHGSAGIGVFDIATIIGAQAGHDKCR